MVKTISTTRTKIIATIGPACLEFQTFQAIVDAGIDYIRINTAYGDEQQYNLILNNLVNSQKQKEVDVILDIKSLDRLDYAIEHNISTLALSFTEKSNEVKEVRKLMPDAFVISKIESEKGVEDFDSILDSSDGIMVARGDLGRAVTLEKVPVLQKEFTYKTLEQGKFLITATEMLLSMVGNPQPTRAEVSDVANAVFDNSSAVMLSEETAIGKYPVKSVEMMVRIIKEAEKWNKQHGKYD